jgi:hypothetical protein
MRALALDTHDAEDADRAATTSKVQSRLAGRLDRRRTVDVMDVIGVIFAAAAARASSSPVAAA